MTIQLQLNLGFAWGTVAAERTLSKKWGGVVAQSHYGAMLRQTAEYGSIATAEQFGATSRETSQYGATVTTREYGTKRTDPKG